MGHFPISAENFDNYGGSLIKQLTPVKKKSFLSFLSFSTVQFWSAMEFTSHVSLFQKCFFFIKSPDNNDPRANSRSMSKFVTIANWQICCFIAKFPINLQFWYKLLGLSWGQSLHQNCKDVKLHITCLIPGLAWPLYPLQSSLHDIIWHVFTGTDTRAHSAHHQICHLSLMGVRSTEEH